MEDLSLTVSEAGYVISMVTVFGALFGALFGIAADRLGHVRVAATGLMINAAGSFLGASSITFNQLLLTRLIESAGFLMAIVALPSLISSISNDRDRPLAMGVWGAFMPVGIALSMLITPTLVDWYGWRGLWNAVGMVMVLASMVLVLAFHRHSRGDSKLGKSSMMLKAALGKGPILVVLCFLFYSGLFVSLTQLFPTLLVSVHGLSVAGAAYLGMLVVLFNLFGNVFSGWLIRRGVPPWKLIFVAFVVMGLSALVIYSSFISAWFKVLVGLLFSAIGGLIPGTAFVLAAKFAVKPSHMALIAGMMFQGAGIGQTLGPIGVSALIGYLGAWDWAILQVVVICCLAFWCVFELRKDAGKQTD